MTGHIRVKRTRMRMNARTGVAIAPEFPTADDVRAYFKFFVIALGLLVGLWMWTGCDAGYREQTDADLTLPGPAPRADVPAPHKDGEGNDVDMVWGGGLHNLDVRPL